ncbi:MAG TPA: beta-galactosidase [Verrucomicrobiae bacterium]|nr:beta-galactosidase [Verrucomicrobiae bacterium]
MTDMTRSLKTCAFLSAAILSGIFQSPAAPAKEKNLVQDGGFEQGGAGWAFSVSGANASGQAVTGEAHSGKKSFRISNNSGFAPNVYGRVTQMVRGLEPFTTYRISCFARGTNAGIVWIGGGPGWYLRAPFPKGTFGWTNVSFEYATGEEPPDFELMVLTESQTEALWVDDISMTPIKSDTAKRDAVLNQITGQWKARQDRLSSLQARAGQVPNSRNDSVMQLGFNVAGRFLKRTERGANALQGWAWTRLQLEEIATVLDATENRLNALAKPVEPPVAQPWPKNGPVQLRDGLFEAKMKNGAEQPFWFYGYGHFGQVIRDLPNFRGLGASLVQDGQVGPSSMNADGSFGGSAIQLFKDLRTARRNGMRIDWLLSPHYFPDWAFAKSPDARGGGLGFIGFDIDHPTTREVLENFTGAITEKMKDDDALFTVCLSNEPVYDKSGRTKYGRSEFDAYLENIHGRIGQLNVLYGTRYTNFSEVAPPANGLKATVNENRAYYDWVRFNQRHFAAWHAWLGSLVKKHLPSTPTHAKIMVFYCLDRDKLHFGVDPELFCDATDLAGCDAYAFPTGDKTYDWMGQEFFYDLLHSFKNQPVFNSENHVIPDGAAPDDVPLATARAQFWQGGLHHQAATTCWVWEEAIDTSLSGSIYFRPANIYGAGRAMLELNRFAAEAAAINRLQARIALLYSPASIFWEDAYKGTIQSCYRQLNFLGEPVDFISEKEFAEGRMPTNEFIIAPAATHVTDATAKNLRRFVETGGHLLLAGAGNFAFDEYHRARPTSEIPAGLQLPSVAQEQAAADALREILANNGIAVGNVIDNATGKPAWGIEFRQATVNGNPVIAMIALDGQNHSASIPALHGKKVVDVLANELIDPDKINLEPMTPHLLEMR